MKIYVFNGSSDHKITSWQRNMLDILILSKYLFLKFMRHVFTGLVDKHFVLVFKSLVCIIYTMEPYHYALHGRKVYSSNLLK